MVDISTIFQKRCTEYTEQTLHLETRGEFY